ncbi:MAG: CsxC family protein [Bacillota bacterium]|uniref:DUF3794 domain-containing protein n=1 Tax=Thermanaerosceptrum fracticalcis TaxID=1712410 RepID=A0A7G6DZ94_THEFR|nr:hypothetical protein [Thermanaerosceptrum fracticalcis]QNB45148.1 hypothetical protein BR63_01710 [Thermanaerosceptrum fracticalcis]
MSCPLNDLATAYAGNILGQPPAIANNWLKPKGVKISKAETQVANVQVRGETINNCINQPIPPTPLATGVVAKIPVVLAELSVQINIAVVFDFPEPTIAIKKVANRLKITQCFLLPNTNTLFIQGLVHKNINYSTRNCEHAEAICGDIRHCTVEIPFKCTTPVTFNVMEPLPVVPASTNEFQDFGRFEVKGPQFAEKDELLTGDSTEFNQITTEFFNELPFCELESSKIVEFNEYLSPVPRKLKAPLKKRVFRSCEEKMVIFLTLKILQNREVAVPPSPC